MTGMDEQQRKINELMANPRPLVSDAEVDAAMDFLKPSVQSGLTEKQAA